MFLSRVTTFSTLWIGSHDRRMNLTELTIVMGEFQTKDRIHDSGIDR